MYKLYKHLILNRIAPSVDRQLIKEQAGFRPGKSCCSQLLNLTQHIKDGYQRGLITGAAFVDRSAAYKPNTYTCHTLHLHLSSHSSQARHLHYTKHLNHVYHSYTHSLQPHLTRTPH